MGWLLFFWKVMVRLWLTVTAWLRYSRAVRITYPEPGMLNFDRLNYNQPKPRLQFGYGSTISVIYGYGLAMVVVAWLWVSYGSEE